MRLQYTLVLALVFLCVQAEVDQGTIRLNKLRARSL